MCLYGIRHQLGKPASHVLVPNASLDSFTSGPFPVYVHLEGHHGLARVFDFLLSLVRPGCTSWLLISAVSVYAMGLVHYNQQYACKLVHVIN